MNGTGTVHVLTEDKEKDLQEKRFNKYDTFYLIPEEIYSFNNDSDEDFIVYMAMEGDWHSYMPE